MDSKHGEPSHRQLLEYDQLHKVLFVIKLDAMRGSCGLI